ncbi:thiamine pyrophosphate-binding protein [Candidatus Woesearchaeota archaeon]|nr:thiamine pyrophosphate-binding protein [Candidatus Woesearchaeota archaeon]
MKLSDYVMSYLKTVTDSIFLVSGGGCMHLVDSVRKSKLNAYCCHHEQGAATAAEGYARLKNDIGVALVTTGPGGTNAVTSVAAAWMDCIPIMVISGQVRTDILIPRDNAGKPLLRQLAPQEINIVDIVKPITKSAVMVTDKNQIRYELEKACHTAKSGKPGPVWIDIPLDIQSAEIEPEKLREFVKPEKPNYRLPTDKIIAELQKAKKPLLLVGHGIRLAGAVDELWEFIEKTEINVVSAMSGDDLVTHDYPYYLGAQGITGVESANKAFDDCDLLLIVGTRMQIRQTSFEYWDFAKNAVKIMVDIDEQELHKKTLKLDIAVVADAKVFFKEMLKHNIKLNRWDVEFKPIIPQKINNYVDIYDFLHELSKLTNYHVVTTNGMACEANHQAFKLKKGQRLMTNTALGQMGKGLPMSIGACVANNRKPVLCMEGDGSIMMNIQELQTLVHNKLPVKIFLFNNGGYYSIRNTHKRYFGIVFAADKATGVSFPEWKKIAEAFGIEYFRIASNKDLSKLNGIINSNKAAFCELVIDPEQKMLAKWPYKK